MSTISIGEAMYYADQAGFQGIEKYIIVAIARAESSLDTTARGINSNGSVDRGILQINNGWHPEVSDAQADDPAQAFKAAYIISHKGQNFGEWATYNNGKYKQFMPKNETVNIDLTIPIVGSYFQAVDSTWLCKSTGKTIMGAILAFYRQFGNSANCGLTFAGLPLTDELDYNRFRQFIGDTKSQLNIPANVRFQKYERVWVCYDPTHAYDNPPGSGDVYLIHMPKG